MLTRYAKLLGKIVMYGFVWPVFIAGGVVGIIGSAIIKH